MPVQKSIAETFNRCREDLGSCNMKVPEAAGPTEGFRVWPGAFKSSLFKGDFPP